MIANRQTNQHGSQKYRVLSTLMVALFILSACANLAGSPTQDTERATTAEPVTKMRADNNNVDNNQMDSNDNDNGKEPAPRADHPAPDFTLTTMAGETVTLSDLKGQPVILNFWASWCGPCRLEMPHLQEAHSGHEDAGLVILGVNLTKRESNLDDVATFIDEFALTFPIVMDEVGDVAKLYEVRGQPASVFIDRNGVIQMVWQGPVNQAFIDEQVADLLES